MKRYICVDTECLPFIAGPFPEDISVQVGEETLMGTMIRPAVTNAGVGFLVFSSSRGPLILRVYAFEMILRRGRGAFLTANRKEI